MPKSVASALWEHYNRTVMTQERIADLTAFKSNLVNFKISLWDPQTNGLRYLKTLLYLLCGTLSPKQWNRLKRIRHREVGAPLTITWGGERVCMDVLQAVLELDFMARHFHFEGSTILEIGAGYGRTCQAILSNEQVERYVIVDLENCLRLAKAYLQRVLEPKTYNRISFVPVTGRDGEKFADQDCTFDLCLNIDSFAEIDAEVVRSYLTYIDTHCRYFYVKNPVGKYLEKPVPGKQPNELVHMALRTGLLQTVIDIYDREIVEAQVETFLHTYQPGPSWRCLAHSWAIPWTYYWQALYRTGARRRLRPAHSPCRL